VSYRPTPQQEQIINHDPSRHGRVLAGSGTGESATVVALIARPFAAHIARWTPPDVEVLAR
jgi:hypothetical protein